MGEPAVAGCPPLGWPVARRRLDTRRSPRLTATQGRDALGIEPVGDRPQRTGEGYDLDELTGDLEDAPDWQPDDEPKQAKTDYELVALFQAETTETGKDSRHEAFRSVVGVLLKRCDQLPPDVLHELALSWAHDHLKPCRPDAELTRNFDNLLARERARREPVA
jgi:hypothetical protein